MNGTIENVSDRNFDDVVLSSDVPVLVDFWAPWCGPCRLIGPVLKTVAKQRGDSVRVVKINVDENPQISEKMGIRSIPTVMLFDDGKLKETMIGARPQADFDQLLDDAIRGKAIGQA